jgi:hypothetical protein
MDPGMGLEAAYYLHRDPPLICSLESNLERRGSIKSLMRLSVFNSRVYYATQAIIFIF